MDEENIDNLYLQDSIDDQSFDLNDTELEKDDENIILSLDSINYNENTGVAIILITKNINP